MPVNQSDAGDSVNTEPESDNTETDKSLPKFGSEESAGIPNGNPVIISSDSVINISHRTP